MQRLGRVHLVQGQFRITEDDAEHIVVIVGHATRQHAHCFHFLGLLKLGRQSELVGDVTLNGHVIDDLAYGVANRRNCCFLGVESPVLALVDHAARPDSAAGDGLPKITVKEFILLAALEDTRILADGLLAAVARRLLEGWVDELDVPLGIGHDNGLSGLLHGRQQLPAFDLGRFAGGDVTDIALDHLALVHQVNIADKLHGDGMPVMGFQRQIIVANVFVNLQGVKSVLRRGNVFERTDFPDMFPTEFVVRITEQPHQERIDINHHPCRGIKNQDTVLG